MHLRSWDCSLNTAICAFFDARFPHVTTPQQTPTPQAAAMRPQAMTSQAATPQQITMPHQTPTPQAAAVRPQARMPQQARTPIKRVSFRPLRNVAPRVLLQ